MHLVCSIFFSTATNHFTVLVTHIVSTNNAVSDSLSCLQISWSRYLASASDPDPTPVPLDHLADHLPFLQSQEIVDSTHHSYQAGIWQYSNFCGSRGWQSFLATEITLCFLSPSWLTKSATRPQSYTWQASFLYTPKTAYWTPSHQHRSFISSFLESSAPWGSYLVSASL